MQPRELYKSKLKQQEIECQESCHQPCKNQLKYSKVERHQAGQLVRHCGM